MKFSQALNVAWNLVVLYHTTPSALKGLVPLLPALRPVSTDPQVQFNLCLGSLQPALLTYGQLAQKPGTSAEVEERPSVFRRVHARLLQNFVQKIKDLPT